MRTILMTTALLLLTGCQAADQQPIVGTDREPTSSSRTPLPSPDSVPVGGAGGPGAAGP